jgi:hypothetical protein
MSDSHTPEPEFRRAAHVVVVTTAQGLGFQTYDNGYGEQFKALDLFTIIAGTFDLGAAQGLLGFCERTQPTQP